jgi:hypothetical protein
MSMTSTTGGTKAAVDAIRERIYQGELQHMEETDRRSFLKSASGVSGAVIGLAALAGTRIAHASPTVPTEMMAGGCCQLTRMEIAGAAIPRDTSVLALAGYHTPGDRGAGAIYAAMEKPQKLEPWHVQSADGRFWQLINPLAHQYFFGAGDGWEPGRDDQPAWQALCDYCSQTHAGFYGAPGRTQIGKPIIAAPREIPDREKNPFRRGPGWEFDANCIIRATARMDAVFQVGDGSWEKIARNGLVSGGLFDQNFLAERGIWVTFANRVIVRDAEVINIPRDGAGIEIGSTLLNEDKKSVPGYEGFVFENRIWGSKALPLPGGSVGIRYTNNSDNHARDNIIMGVSYGIATDNASGWDGKYFHNHLWNYPENGPMEVATVLYGDNFLCGNQVDGPFLTAHRFLGPRNHVVGGRFNYGGGVADRDNLAVLFRLEQSGELTVTNSGAKGQAGKRIAAEVSFGKDVSPGAFRKDGSDYYVNVIDLAPVNIPAQSDSAR